LATNVWFVGVAAAGLLLWALPAGDIDRSLHACHRRAAAAAFGGRMRGQWHVVSVRRWLHAHGVVDVVLHCGSVVVCIVCGRFNNWSRVAGVLPSAGGGSPRVL